MRARWHCLVFAAASVLAAGETGDEFPSAGSGAEPSIWLSKVKRTVQIVLACAFSIEGLLKMMSSESFAQIYNFDNI